MERISLLADCFKEMKNAIILNESGNEIIRPTMGAYKIADMMRTDGWTVEVIDWVSVGTMKKLKNL